MLRQAFDYPYAEIAAMLQLTEANAPKVISRAAGTLAAVASVSPSCRHPGIAHGHRVEADVARQVVSCRASAAAAWSVTSSTSSSQYPVG